MSLHHPIDLLKGKLQELDEAIAFNNRMYGVMNTQALGHKERALHLQVEYDIVARAISDIQEVRGVRNAAG